MRIIALSAVCSALIGFVDVLGQCDDRNAQLYMYGLSKPDWPSTVALAIAEFGAERWKEMCTATDDSTIDLSIFLDFNAYENDDPNLKVEWGYINATTLLSSSCGQGEVCLPPTAIDPSECNFCGGAKVCLPQSFINPALTDNCSVPGEVCRFQPPACERGVVDQTFRAKFFEYVITECMNGVGDGVSFTGRPTRGPAECLAQWIVSAGGVYIPHGECRTAFQGLLRTLSKISHSDFVAALEGQGDGPCRYDLDQVIITNRCEALLRPFLIQFKTTAGYVEESSQELCTPYTVSKLDAHENIYVRLMNAALVNGTDPTIPVFGDLGMPSSPCTDCYHDFFHRGPPVPCMRFHAQYRSVLILHVLPF